MTNREFLTAIANSTNLSSDLTEFATEQIAKMDARNEARKASSKPRKVHLLHALDSLEPTSDEYHTVMNRMKDIHAMQLEELHEKNEVLKLNASMEINPNTVIATGGSIAAILLIMNYERLHALTSKGVSIATRMIPRLV